MSKKQIGKYVKIFHLISFSILLISIIIFGIETQPRVDNWFEFFNLGMSHNEILTGIIFLLNGLVGGIFFFSFDYSEMKDVGNHIRFLGIYMLLLVAGIGILL